MTSKQTMAERIGLASLALTATVMALIAAIGNTSGTAQASNGHRHADDCRLVPADVRTLCGKVRAQREYGWINPSGSMGATPNGRVVVREIVHQGLSKAEVRDYLRGAARDYRLHVTHVPVNVDRLGKGCQAVVETVPGKGWAYKGIRMTQVVTVCP